MTPAAPGTYEMRRRSDGLTAAGRTEDDRELLQDSYWRQAGIVIGVFWFPPSGHPPHILILWSQPTGIRDISSPPSRMLSVQQQNTERWLPENNDLCCASLSNFIHALTCCCTRLWRICNAQRDSLSDSWASAAQRSSPSHAADSPYLLHSAFLREHGKHNKVQVSNTET